MSYLQSMQHGHTLFSWDNYLTVNGDMDWVRSVNVSFISSTSHDHLIPLLQPRFWNCASSEGWTWCLWRRCVRKSPFALFSLSPSCEGQFQQISRSSSKQMINIFHHKKETHDLIDQLNRLPASFLNSFPPLFFTNLFSLTLHFVVFLPSMHASAHSPIRPTDDGSVPDCRITPFPALWPPTWCLA